MAQGQAAPSAEARNLFRQGNDLRARGDLKGALDRFQRAYRLFPSYKIQLNIATMLFLLDRPAEAARHYHRYFTHPKTRDPSFLVDRARQRFSACRRRVCELVLRCAVSGATVKVNGAIVGKTPLVSPIFLRAGRHDVLATAGGHEAFSRTLNLAAGQRAELELRLPRTRAASSRPVRPRGRPVARPLTETGEARDLSPARRRLRIAGWSTLGGALALGTIAAVLYGVGETRGSDAHDAYRALTAADPESSFQQARDDMASARGQITAGHVLAGTAAVALGVSIYLLVTSRPEKRQGGGQAVTVGVSMDHGPGILVMSRF